jgi:hypothetical protein
MIVLLGTVDVSFMLYDWAQANKAAYDGVHRAIVSNPVPQSINDLTYGTNYLGQACSGGHCPTVNSNNLPLSSVCTGVAKSDPPAATCTNEYTNDDTAFNYIFTPMKNIFPRLQPENVTISYQRNNNLGFVGQPRGLPMELTVSIGSINPMRSQFYFLKPLVEFISALYGSGGGSITATPQIGTYATTLISEDMVGTVDAP